VNVADSNNTKYVADNCNVGSSNVVASVGGSYNKNLGSGLFSFYGNDESDIHSGIGARLQYLP
jgi:hypothetical protein